MSVLEEIGAVLGGETVGVAMRRGAGFSHGEDSMGVDGASREGEEKRNPRESDSSSWIGGEEEEEGGGGGEERWSGATNECHLDFENRAPLSEERSRSWRSHPHVRSTCWRYT